VLEGDMPEPGIPAKHARIPAAFDVCGARTTDWLQTLPRMDPQSA